MAGKIAFSLEEIENMIETLVINQKKYNDVLGALKREVELVNQSWVSKETKTFEKFKEGFDEKYPKLERCEELLKAFKEALGQAHDDLEEAENQSYGSIE